MMNQDTLRLTICTPKLVSQLKGLQEGKTATITLTLEVTRREGRLENPASEGETDMPMVNGTPDMDKKTYQVVELSGNLKGAISKGKAVEAAMEDDDDEPEEVKPVKKGKMGAAASAAMMEED